MRVIDAIAPIRAYALNQCFEISRTTGVHVAVEGSTSKIILALSITPSREKMYGKANISNSFFILLNKFKAITYTYAFGRNTLEVLYTRKNFIQFPQ